MNTVIREEKKYLITTTERYKLDNKLKKVLSADIHNDTGGYKVRSLYYDTIYSKDFHDKVDGIEIRRKIRLRVYNPTDNFATLEIKQKEGANQLKRSLKIDREDAINLVKGNYGVLLKYPNDFAKECYALMNMYCYRPKAVVEYNRKAYIAKENKIRITFDTNVVATESCFDIFSEKLNMYEVFKQDNTILEVKYNGFLLSYIKDLIDSVDKSELSVSKYCLGRKITLDYLYLS